MAMRLLRRVDCHLYELPFSRAVSNAPKQRPKLKEQQCYHAHRSYSRSNRGKFYQIPPQLYNPFIEDTYVQSLLGGLIPAEVLDEVFEDLEQFGNKISREIEEVGRRVELEPPYLKSFSAWGKRVDYLVTSSAWKRMHEISASEGLVALAYERKHQQWSRVHQMAKLFLFSPSSGLYSCPLAMTDGAAKLIEDAGKEFVNDHTFGHLTSRNPENFWTSGQWMTERKGGSDVAGGTETVAIGPHSDGSYHLHGYKWFTSATDANMAFTLARPLSSGGEITAGTKGLSLFYLETRDDCGEYNNLEIQCLKNKLGTRQLPTGEILLDGTKAFLVGEPGRGVAGIAPMLSITRLHNSISAIGIMRRILQLSRDYSTKRVAFGKYLVDHPLHMRTLAEMEVETRGCIIFTFEVCRLQGLIDCNMATSTDKLLHRILTPILKLYTAKQAVRLASEGLESFGGQGYIEDTGLPVLLRDAQVLPIWEGTTNILSLDVLRVIRKSGPDALMCIVDSVKSRLDDSQKLTFNFESDVAHLKAQLKAQLNSLVLFASKAVQDDSHVFENASRDFAFSVAQIYVGSLLIEHALREGAAPVDRLTAQRWCRRPIVLQEYCQYCTSEVNMNSSLVMNGYSF